MVAWNRAKEDKTIDNPQLYVENLKLPGYYRCCLYKWKKSREMQQWTVLCSTAPRLMQRCKEVPNNLRKVLGLPKKFLQRRSTESNELSAIMPSALETAVTDILAS